MTVRRAVRGPFALLLLVVLLLAALPDARHAVLRGMGGVLVTRDPLAPADVIVLSVDADGAGVLEAADLVQRGLASRIALFAAPPVAVDREFARRGVPFVSSASISRQHLRDLGISEVEQIVPDVSGTEEEAVTLPRWCGEHGYRTVIFVCPADHSRRVRRALDRALQGHAMRVLVRPSSYSGFSPDSWWLSRGGVRTQIVESEKLLLDILRHPFAG